MTSPLTTDDVWDRRIMTGARAVLWLTAIGASLGLTLASLALGESWTGYVRDNALARSDRLWLVLRVLAGASSGMLVLVFIGFLQRRRGLDHGLAVAEQLGRRLAPAALVFVLPLLLDWRLWEGRELTFMLAASAFALLSLFLWQLSLTTAPVLPPAWRQRVSDTTSQLRRALSWPPLPLVVVIMGALGYASYFSYCTLANHFNLGTSSYDLGIENNLLWNLIHGGPLFKTTPHGAGPNGSHLGYHHTYFSFVLAPLYALAPHPETLLVIQAAFIGAAAVPLFLLAKLRLPPWTAATLAIAYLLYAPVHRANLYDFHYQTLMPFFMWFLVYFAEKGRTLAALVFALLAISLREDIAGCVALLGAYLVLSGTRSRLGLSLMFLGLLHFVVVKMVVMPAVLDGRSSYLHQYQDLVPAGLESFGGVLTTVIGNPGYTLHTLVVEKQKLVYLLQILTPLVFLPWLRPIGLLLSLPGLFFTLLSTRYAPMIQISFQYTFFWTPFVFLASIRALEWLGTARDGGDEERPRQRRRAWLLALVGAVIVTSYQHGAVLQPHTARGGFSRVELRPTEAGAARHADLYRLITSLPADASVAATERLVPHVSSRENAYTIRMGVFDAEYLLFDLRPRKLERRRLEKALSRGDYGIVRVEGKFALARRGHDTSRNSVFLKDR